MKFICTNKGRFSVYGQGLGFAEFIDGMFETDNANWLNVLKNVQGVQLVEGAIPTFTVEETAPSVDDMRSIPVKRQRGRPRKDKR